MIGESLGRYRLEATRRDHGPGAVYRAEDTLVGRRVVLQLVPDAAAADPERLDRIRHETVAAAGFVHPGVVSCYGLEEADGRWFVTSELVEGPNLEELAAGPPPPLERVLELGAALADVLAAARAAGVVHGRLRPSDVLLAADGSLRVRGFGLGELRRADAEVGAETPRDAACLPPEAVRGIRPDHRGDLFACGRLLRDLARRAAPESELPAALRQLLERCLEDDPAARPASADELRRALEELRRDEFREREARAAAAAAAGAAAAEPVAPPWRRWLLPAAGLLAVLVAALVLWRLVRPGPPPEPAPAAVTAAAGDLLDLAVLPFDNLGTAEDEPLAAGFSRELTRLLEVAPELSVVAPASAGAAAAATAGPLEAGRQLGVAHVLVGSFLWQGDPEISRLAVGVRLLRVADGEQLWSESLDAFFAEAVDLQGRIGSALAVRLRGRPPAEPSVGGRVTASLEAYLAYLEGLGRRAGATTAAGLRGAAVALERATLLDPEMLVAHVERVLLGVALAAAEPGAGHLDAAGRVLAAARRIGPGRPEVLRASATLAAAGGGGDDGLLAELETALERFPRDAALLRAAALIDRRRGRWETARERLGTAQRQDPWDLGLLGELVETLARVRRFDEAGRRVELARARMPAEPRPRLLAADLLLRGGGALDEAAAVLARMPEEMRSAPGYGERMLTLELYRGEYPAALARLAAAPPDEPRLLLERAWIHRHAGRPRAATADFELLRQSLEDRLEREPENAELHGLIGLAYAGTGLGRQGIGRGQRATVLVPVTDDAFAGPEHVERLARIYVLAGDAEHALDELTFLLEIPSPVSVALLRLDPVWAPLRDLPRFRELLEHHERRRAAEAAGDSPAAPG